MSGTHAIYLALSGLLKHGDTMISLSGAPYDTLCSVIGILGDSRNSLIANGIKYEQIDLIGNDFDIPAICDRLKRNDVRLVEIQRSWWRHRGDGWILRRQKGIDSGYSGTAYSTHDRKRSRC